MSKAEDVLVKKARDGDVAAFEELIRQHQQKVFNIAYRMCQNYDDASDMAQEALIKVYLNFDKFDGKSQFSTWLYRVTTNSCLDQIKKKKKNPTVSLDNEIETKEGTAVREMESPDRTPEEEMENKELSRELNECLKKLSEKHRNIIILRDINGMAYEDIAKTLLCSVGTVKSRVNRARAALKKILINSELFLE